jgi:hypothetical protein
LKVPGDTRVSTPETIKNIPESIDSAPETIKNIPESIDSAPETIKNIPESIDSTPETIKNIPESIDSAPEIKKSGPESTDSAPSVRRSVSLYAEQRGIFVVHPIHTVSVIRVPFYFREASSPARAGRGPDRFNSSFQAEYPSPVPPGCRSVST